MIEYLVDGPVARNELVDERVGIEVGYNANGLVEIAELELAVNGLQELAGSDLALNEIVDKLYGDIVERSCYDRGVVEFIERLVAENGFQRPADYIVERKFAVNAEEYAFGSRRIGYHVADIGNGDVTGRFERAVFRNYFGKRQQLEHVAESYIAKEILYVFSADEEFDQSAESVVVKFFKQSLFVERCGGKVDYRAYLNTVEGIDNEVENAVFGVEHFLDTGYAEIVNVLYRLTESTGDFVFSRFIIIYRVVVEPVDFFDYSGNEAFEYIAEEYVVPQNGNAFVSDIFKLVVDDLFDCGFSRYELAEKFFGIEPRYSADGFVYPAESKVAVYVEQEIHGACAFNEIVNALYGDIVERCGNEIGAVKLIESILTEEFLNNAVNYIAERQVFIKVYEEGFEIHVLLQKIVNVLNGDTQGLFEESVLHQLVVELVADENSCKFFEDVFKSHRAVVAETERADTEFAFDDTIKFVNGHGVRFRNDGVRRKFIVKLVAEDSFGKVGKYAFERERAIFFNEEIFKLFGRETAVKQDADVSDGYGERRLYETVSGNEFGKRHEGECIAYRNGSEQAFNGNAVFPENEAYHVFDPGSESFGKELLLFPIGIEDTGNVTESGVAEYLINDIPNVAAFNEVDNVAYGNVGNVGQKFGQHVGLDSPGAVVVHNCGQLVAADLIDDETENVAKENGAYLFFCRDLDFAVFNGYPVCGEVQKKIGNVFEVAGKRNAFFGLDYFGIDSLERVVDNVFELRRKRYKIAEREIGFEVLVKIVIFIDGFDYLARKELIGKTVIESVSFVSCVGVVIKITERRRQKIGPDLIFAEYLGRKVYE